MPKRILDKNGNYTEVSGHVKDLNGKRFGRLVVIGLDCIDQKKRTHWICVCDCGNHLSVLSDSLVSGRTQSCGCYHREKSAKIGKQIHTKHGLSYSHKLYGVWKNIRSRCNNPNNPSYGNYGDRGISISGEWDEFPNFLEWSLSHGYKDGLTIDRINNDGDYSPENCRWVDNTIQQRNRRRTVKLTFKGETRALSEWCEMFGLNMKTCYGRLHNYGWTNPYEILFGKGGAY